MEIGIWNEDIRISQSCLGYFSTATSPYSGRFTEFFLLQIQPVVK